MALRAESIADGIPLDTFGTRLAIVRQALGGWNVKKTAEHFGLDPGSWRNWEAGGSCRTREEVCRTISDASGISYEWLMVGGPLRNRCFSSGVPVTVIQGAVGHVQTTFAFDRVLAGVG